MQRRKSLIFLLILVLAVGLITAGCGGGGEAEVSGTLSHNHYCPGMPAVTQTQFGGQLEIFGKRTGQTIVIRILAAAAEPWVHRL